MHEPARVITLHTVNPVSPAMHFCLTLLLFSPWCATSQILPFHTYTAKDGLPSSEIHAVVQDTRGFLWVGTTEGIGVYDGNSFTTYSTLNGLASNSVNDIIEEREAPGTMWIATYGGGVSKYQRGAFTTTTFSGMHLASGARCGPSADFINCLMESTDGTIWCGADTGVFCIAGDSIRPFHPETVFRGVNAIIELPDGDVWIAAEPGLFHYKRSTDEIVNIDFGEGINLAQAACTDKSGNLWIGTLGGNILKIRDGKIISRFATGVSHTLGWQTFFAMHIDDEGYLWAGTRFGILRVPIDRMRPENLAHISVENGLPDNTVRCLFIDREESIWAGTQGKGIARLTERGLSRFAVPVFFSTSNNRCGIVDSSGHLWICPPGELWEFWRDGVGVWHKALHRFADVMPQGEPEISWQLYYSPRHELWVFAGDFSVYAFAITRRNGDASRLVRRREFRGGEELPKSLCGIVARNGYLWLSVSQGVAVVDPASPPRILRTLTPSDGLPQSSIRAIYEDRDGNIWLGGGYGGGIAMVPRGDWRLGVTRRITLADGLANDFIRAFGEDARGRLMIGTRFGGLQVLENGHLTTYSIRNGLKSNAIWSISTDSSGRSIIGTNVGLQFFDETSQEQFTSSDELAGELVASAGISEHGFVWMATSRMLTLMDYPVRPHRRIAPPAYITDVAVNGERRPAQNPLTLSYDLNNITLHFVGISLRNERQNSYRYRLLETDREWQPLTKQSSVTYAALKPGSYRFEVKGINSDGVESLEPAVLTFTILSPFWLTWWFILLVNVAVLLLITTAYRYRLNQLVEVERMRTRIATDLHDDIGSSLSRIALFSEVARVEAARISPRMVEMAEKIGQNARELLDSVGTLVWSIDPRHDRFDDLETHLKNFAQEMFTLKGIDYSFVAGTDTGKLRLPLDARKNILLIFKEAVNNVVRHSRCKKVEIRIGEGEEALSIAIADDGIGIGRDISKQGHGMVNMKSRASAVGGTLDIRPGQGGGTVVEFRLPLVRRE